MKKAIIYARYSSDSQTEQSIEGQLRVCREYAQNNDILIVDTYIDRAMTGTNDNRVAFQKMLKDSSRKQWQYLIVYKLDRFSRNKFESVIHKKTLRDNGVTILSAMENLTDSPEHLKLTKEHVTRTEKEIETTDKTAISSNIGSYKLCHTAPWRQNTA